MAPGWNASQGVENVRTLYAGESLNPMTLVLKA